MKYLKIVFIVYLYICSLTFQVNSKEISSKKYFFPAKDKYPSEFIFLIESLQTYDLKPLEKNTLTISVYVLDYLTSFISQDDLSFILKILIHKHILNIPPSNLGRTKSFKNPSAEIKNYLDLHDKKLHSFAKWFLYSLLKDFEDIDQSIYYSQANKSIKRPDKSDTTSKNKKINRKLKILSRVFGDMTSMTPDEIHIYLKDHMFSILKILSNNSWILGQFSQFKSISRKDLKFEKKYLTSFSLDTIDSQLPQDSILKKFLLTIPKKTGSKKAYNEALQWIPKEHDFMPKKFLFPKKDPNYVSPPKLPNPTDDWDKEYAELKLKGK